MSSIDETVWHYTKTGTRMHAFLGPSALCSGHIRRPDGDTAGRSLASAGEHACTRCVKRFRGMVDRYDASLAPSTGEGDHLPPAAPVAAAVQPGSVFTRERIYHGDGYPRTVTATATVTGLVRHWKDPWTCFIHSVGVRFTIVDEINGTSHHTLGHRDFKNAWTKGTDMRDKRGNMAPIVSRRLRDAGWAVRPAAESRQSGVFVTGSSNNTVTVTVALNWRSETAEDIKAELGSWPEVSRVRYADMAEPGADLSAVKILLTYTPKGK